MKLKPFVPLKPGDIVDITAPSSPPLSDGERRRGLQILESWNLKPRFPDKALQPWLWHANTNPQRAFFLKQAFARSDGAAVWALRGGYGLQKIMPSFIKYFEKNLSGKSGAPRSKRLSGKKPGAATSGGRGRAGKLFIGYSDSSPLHFHLNNHNQPTVHAPAIADLKTVSPRNLSLLKQLLFGEKKETVFRGLKAVLPPLFLKKRRGGGKSRSDRLAPASGGAVLTAPIRGGNLSLLAGSAGTGRLPRLAGCFLFVEDVNEAAFRIDRMLWNLFACGALRGVKAILFGSFHPLKTRQIQSPLSESLSSIVSVPLVFGLPCGHGAQQRPLPLNCPAELNIQDPSSARLKISLS